jgi:LEA14-like dessication related protein
MHKRSIILTCLSIFVAAAMLAGCAGMEITPTEKNFNDPVITLSHVEIPYYTGYYYFSKKVKPTKGTAGDYGAPMSMAFIFDIENPNEYPIQLDGLKFSVNFEEFEVNTVNSPETMWIPAGKTNQVRVPAMFDTRQTLLTLLLPGAMKLGERKMSPWQVLEKWWTGAPDFSFPVYVKEGAAIFKADGLTKVITFKATFPE